METKIKALGWTIIRMNVGEGNDAFCDYETKTLAIKPGLNDETYARVLCHEAVHIIQHELDKLKFSSVSEKMIAQLKSLPDGANRLKAGAVYWKAHRDSYPVDRWNVELPAAILQYFPEIVEKFLPKDNGLITLVFNISRFVEDKEEPQLWLGEYMGKNDGLLHSMAKLHYKFGFLAGSPYARHLPDGSIFFEQDKLDTDVPTKWNIQVPQHMMPDMTKYPKTMSVPVDEEGKSELFGYQLAVTIEDLCSPGTEKGWIVYRVSADLVKSIEVIERGNPLFTARQVEVKASTLTTVTHQPWEFRTQVTREEISATMSRLSGRTKPKTRRTAPPVRQHTSSPIAEAEQTITRHSDEKKACVDSLLGFLKPNVGIEE